MNLGSPSFSLPSSGIAGVCHHARFSGRGRLAKAGSCEHGEFLLQAGICTVNTQSWSAFHYFSQTPEVEELMMKRGSFNS